MSKDKKIWKGPDLALRLELEGRVLHEGRAAELKFPLQIGRKSVCVWNVPADERSVSGLHAELAVRKSKEIVIRDLGSRNGIFISGARVSEYPLTAGTQVSIGQCQLIVEKRQTDGENAFAPYHRIEQLSGAGAPQSWELKNSVTPIGTIADEGIRCAGLSVSRRHAEIVKKPDDSCWIKDLGSRNGTCVNGIRLKENERLLRNGDVFSIADLEFKFCDRRCPPPGPRLVRTLLVAAATSAICFASFFAYQWMFPSAKALLAEAGRYEERENFDLALSVLEKAIDARGGDDYRNEIDRKRAELNRWKETIKIWKSVHADFEKRYWIDANDKLGNLLDSGVDKWGWNTTTAAEGKKVARLMSDVLKVFLASRKMMGGDFSESRKGSELECLSAGLADMEMALGRKDWDETVPTGMLREDMKEQRKAMSAIIDDLRRAEKLTRKIAASDIDGQMQYGSSRLCRALRMTEGFEKLISDYESIISQADEREARRKEDAEKNGRKFVTSQIVKQQCERFIPTLRKFVEARRLYLRNLHALVSLDGRPLVPELPFPSEQQLKIFSAFGDVYRELNEANQALLGEVDSAMRDQIERLQRWKLLENPLPLCIEKLLDDTVMARVFACDTLDGPYCRTDRTVRSGRYDEVLGIESFSEYIDNIMEDRTYPSTSESIPEPVIATALRLFRQIAMFSRYLNGDETRFLVTLEVPNGNKLKRLADAVSALDEKRSLMVDEWWEWKSASRRERLIAKGAAMALDLEGSLKGREEDVRRLKLELRAELTSLKRRLDANPESVSEIRPLMLKTGYPRFMSVNMYWEQECKATGRGYAR